MLRLIPCLILMLCITACAKKQPQYSPHENLLSIATEFQLLTKTDPYRQAPGRDLTNQSIARVTMVRLNNYSSLHPGRFEPEIAMLRGRALEWLGDFQSAQESYNSVSDSPSELAPEASLRSAILAELLFARSRVVDTGDLATMLTSFRDQANEYRNLAAEYTDPFYRGLALREAEEAEVRRAELMAANRYIIANGEAQAQKALEALVQDHPDSRRAAEHALSLARFHRSLAEEEMRLHPPEQGTFSSERFRLHYDEALELLYRLSQADGYPERPIARHDLDALLALGEYVSERAQ